MNSNSGFLNNKTEMPITRHKLNNGLDLIIVQNGTTPIVCVNIAYKVGSQDEEFDKTGFAHLFEHLMFEGSQNTKKGDFDKLCSAAGGTNNAYTTYDRTNYYMTLPSTALDLGLWLESDRMTQFAVSKESFKNQQNVVIEEINQTVNEQPYGRWRDLAVAKAFDKKSSYSWEVHGSQKHVAAVTMADAERFYKRFYAPDNACLVLTGKVDPQEAIEKTEKYFGGIPSAEMKRTRNIFKDEYNLGGETVSYEDNVNLPATFIMYHAPACTDDEIFTADILAEILGNGKSSRLYKSLVYNKQIASQVGAYVDKREHGSLFVFYAVASSTDTDCDQLYEAIQETISDIHEKGIEERELQKTQNQLNTQITFEIQYGSGIADLTAQNVLFWDDETRLYSLRDYYRKPTVENVNDFVKKYLIPDNSTRANVLVKITD
ncbi:MAG: insulinase family protein [Chlorobi bacterium]|nr:insulinase family protein [Chlorobiota bacterium]